MYLSLVLTLNALEGYSLRRQRRPKTMYHAEHKHGVDLVEIKSSLGLQVLMYYQGFYSLVYFAVSGGAMMNKVYNYGFSNAVLELLTVPIFFLWSATELARVPLGYIGNVSEKVPMMSAFLLLTMFPQLVAVAFFTFMQDPIFPFDVAAGALMLLFLILELIVGKRSVDVLIQRQTAQFFRLCQEEEFRRMTQSTIEEKDDDDDSRGRRDSTTSISSDIINPTPPPQNNNDPPPPSRGSEDDQGAAPAPAPKRESLLSQVLRRRLSTEPAEERQALLSDNDYAQGRPLSGGSPPGDSSKHDDDDDDAGEEKRLL